MSIDRDQLRTSIEAGIQRLGSSLDEQIRSLMDELWRAAERDRDAAVDDARLAAAADLAEACAAAEARGREEGERANMTAASAAVGHDAGETTRLRHEIAACEAELARARQQLSAGGGGAAPTPASPYAVSTARLARATRRFDDSRSLTEVLDTLAETIGDEAPRTVVLLMKGDMAQAWQPTGFHAGLDRTTHAVTPSRSSVVGRALIDRDVSFDRTERGGEAALSGLAFADITAGHASVAVPLILGGRIVAIAYADDVGDRDLDGESWPAAIEVLVRHAGRCLEALTAQRTARSARGGPR